MPNKKTKTPKQVAGHMLSGDDLKIARAFNGDTETMQVLAPLNQPSNT